MLSIEAKKQGVNIKNETNEEQHRKLLLIILFTLLIEISNF